MHRRRTVDRLISVLVVILGWQISQPSGLFCQEDCSFAQLTTTASEFIARGSVVGIRTNVASPSFSPDGTQIVFLSLASDLPGVSNVDGSSEIVVFDLPSGRFLQITNTVRATFSIFATGASHSPRFSPDGTQLVFVSDAFHVPDPDASPPNDEIVLASCPRSLGILGSNDYCVHTGPCGAGAGDCDGNYECQPGLVCRHNVGAQYGFRPIVDVCEALPVGSNDYCALTGPCGVGEGDCDGNHECQAGLVCVNNVGVQYGFRPIVDVCEAPAVGSNDYCVLTGPCGAGQGDCDGNQECQAGLVCRYDVGANYGFSPIVDVCEAPADGGSLSSVLVSGMIE